jgi:hypothetical protein
LRSADAVARVVSVRRRPDESGGGGQRTGRDADVQQFLDEGFLVLRGAVDPDVTAACADLLWAETGFDRDDPTTWTQPVVWVGDMAQPPFAEAANTPAVVAALDAVVDPGRWVPRRSLGSFPLRFPHLEEPDDAGWHIEGSYLPRGRKTYHANVCSKDRALLLLFLFTDVGDADAPTLIRIGSHLDIPRVLAPYGEDGVSIFRAAQKIDAASAHRPLASATGSAGDVPVCHPFLVHAAQPHHGNRPRFLAQPPIAPAVPSIHSDRW